ncbi:sideroflexin-2 isoform X2 [Taeniopygia guttata]|uniref:sideroflexin-2 isoform X2 n=1 Tax=Taeniopygia guttata TaxID=59729 RepID=UPI003BB8984C
MGNCVTPTARRRARAGGGASAGPRPRTARAYEAGPAGRGGRGRPELCDWLRAATRRSAGAGERRGGGRRERGLGAQTYAKMATASLSFNIDSPRWDQSTFVGRLKHFLNITDPRTVLVPEEELDQAKALVEGCRAGLVPPGSSQEQLLYAKKLYDSAFHPDSGEKMNLIGRMSFQVPGGMAITGCMLQFYRTVPAVVFWQWVNQSFNAFVNYTNRNAASPISLRQIGVAYVTATGAALATAVGLNLYTKRAPPLLARWVPFAAVAAANCVNIPMMRQQEIIHGITVTDENNNELGRSRRAAVKGIAQVVLSRITMAAPGMIILPIIMERLEKFTFMQPPVHGASSLCPLPPAMLPCTG